MYLRTQTADNGQFRFLFLVVDFYSWLQTFILGYVTISASWHVHCCLVDALISPKRIFIFLFIYLSEQTSTAKQR